MLHLRKHEKLLVEAIDSSCVVLSQPICLIPIGQIPRKTSRVPDNSFLPWTDQVDPDL